MIKKYKKYNESLLDKLKGPTKEEIFKYYETTDINQIFIDAVYENKVDIVEFALDNGADITYKDNRALTLCVMYGSVDIAILLLERGIDITYDNYIALKQAEHRNHTVLIKLFYKYIDKNSLSYRYYIGNN